MTERSAALEWYYQHRDQERARMREWRRQRPADERLAYERQYRADRRALHRQWAHEWRAKNPDRAAAMQAAQNANARARRAGVTGSLSVRDIVALWNSQPACVDCAEGRGVDHVVALRDGGPNEAANLQNLCRRCNSAKNVRTAARGPRGRLA